MASKYGLDKFYTKKEIAKKLISNINLNNFNSIVEPSAGNGSFSSQINNCIALDIEPENDKIQEQDFFNFQGNLLSGPILVVGNPPFGRNGSLALSFIKKSSEFADVIAFILPQSFRKQSFQDKIPLHFWLVKEILLKEKSFIFNGIEIDIPCVFQIYEKRTVERKKEKKLKPTKFLFTKKEEANIAVRRVGVYAGKAFKEIDDKSIQSHYFIKCLDVDHFIKIIDKVRWEENNTIGPRSISKQELIKAIDIKL